MKYIAFTRLKENSFNYPKFRNKLCFDLNPCVQDHSIVYNLHIYISIK